MWFNPRWPAPMTHFTRNWHKHFQFTVLDSQLEVMAHPCSQDSSRHWSFCSGASSHSSKRSAKGLTDHLRFFAHRVLFVRKGSDAIDPFLWSGLSTNRMTAEGQHAKHTVLSSGSGMSHITMTATAYGWCHHTLRLDTSVEEVFECIAVCHLWKCFLRWTQAWKVLNFYVSCCYHPFA